jgi:isochorismate synthase
MTIDADLEKAISQYSFLEICDALFSASVQFKYSIAVYKLSGSNDWEVMVGKSELLDSEVLIEELERGFIINGFENRGLEGSLYLKASLYFKKDVEFPKGEMGKLGEDFSKVFFEELLKTKKKSKATTTYAVVENTNQQGERDYFQDIIEKAVETIHKGKFQKVILSRIKMLNLEGGFSPMLLFEKLSSFYQNAFTSLTFTPETGIWIGASPEILISVKDNIFRTCALAGTQQYQENLPLKQVPWTQKEIEEQAFVCRYIISCFKKIRLREYLEEGPKTVRAGNLTHLRSDFSVDLGTVYLPNLASEMLDLLHPTSAVCGMPHKPAFDFIVSNEKFKRELYAGYLGPVNSDNSTHLYVNLRCMKVDNHSAYLFAGVGITEDSLWEKEWQETEIKFRTLLNVLDS